MSRVLAIAIDAWSASAWSSVSSASSKASARRLMTVIAPNARPSATSGAEMADLRP